jgi:RimJ/RimL family protein N-acetyltransferase
MTVSQQSSVLSHRPASLKDFDAVYGLYMDEETNLFLTYDPMEKKAFEPLYIELLTTGTLYVADLNGEVAASYRLIPKTHRQSDTVYLGGFVIKPSLKGKGLGTQALQHIRDKALEKGVKRIELTVDLHNEAAINLYKKLGFVTEGIVRKSYKLSSGNEYYDEYLMGLVL